MENPRGEITGKAVAAKDPGTGHFYVSLVKSVIRIVGCVFLITGSLVGAGVALLIAELLGIVEELVD